MRIATFALAAAPLLQAALTPEHLRTEYQVHPLNVDAQQPRLSWALQSTERNKRQIGWQVQVASALNGAADLWDSGRVASAETAQITYQGKALASHQRCFWRVRVWDERGAVSGWSAPAEWSMGILRPEDWKAEWMALRAPKLTSGPLPLFRKEFRVEKAVRRAIVYSSAGGFHEVYLNGAKVGEDVLSPLWSNYRKSVYYVAHDVTSLLKVGANAIGVEVGNGFYNVAGGRYVKFTASFGTPTAIVMLRVEHDDGSITTAGSGGSWKAAPGPTVFSCIHGGEDYDARLEQPGWDRAGFDDSSWQRAGFDGAPGGELRAQTASPVKVMERIGPAKQLNAQVWDLGRNFAGWPRIKVRGRAGSFVRMKTGELLTTDGRVDQGSATGQRGNTGPFISFQYTLKGEGVEEWHPRFSYTGFRYLEVEGDAEVVSIEGDFVHNSAARAGSFRTSDATLNRINELVDNAVRSNFQSVLTDCPHREKLGWLEVIHLMGPAILSNFDAAGFYAKVARDTRESQLDSGLVPDISPEYTVFRGGFRDSPEWGAAVFELPWLLYRFFGDKQTLADSWDAMVRYERYLASTAKDGIVSHGLGDWYDIGPGGPGASKLTPKGITATAFHYRALEVLASAAAVLGKAGPFAAQAEEVRTGFNKAFLSRQTGYYGTGSQAAQAIPLVFGLAPATARAGVTRQLVADMEAKGNTAGDIGYRFVVRALTDAGRPDLLYRVSTQGYGQQIAKGVTSLAEAWDANPASSQNHCMLGHIQEWFITGLVGISQAEDSVGFSKIVIRPQVVKEVTWVEGHYDSIRGRIASRWRIEDGMVRLKVTVPPNTAATVYVPGEPTPRTVASGEWEFRSIVK